jgi:hypothetical protein
MLVPVIAGSDKTTVSVATSHQEYHPVYISPGIFTNTARHGHGNAVLPVAFLPIPKSMSYLLFHFLSLVSELYFVQRVNTKESGPNSNFFAASFTVTISFQFHLYTLHLHFISFF